jgi:hypothetical protein
MLELMIARRENIGFPHVRRIYFGARGQPISWNAGNYK